MLLFLPVLAADLSLTPADDWCAAINAAEAGTLVSLSAGDFAGPCRIGQSVTVMGHDSHIVYEGTSSNVLDIAADDVEILGLSFGPTNPDIDAVKIRAGARVSVSLNTFDRIGGISISANSADTSQVYVISNVFTDLQATGVYLGCHDGTCASTDFFIANNRFDGVTSPDVGYAIETKLNSYGEIGGNDIRDAQGPGITVYGSENGDLTTVEGNVVVSSRAAATLEIAGGPALVRNNVVIGGASGGLYVYDYDNRGLAGEVEVLGNTLYGIGGSAVVLDGPRVSFVDNAVGRDDGGASELDGAGNVDCGDGVACWVDVGALDFWPKADGPLVGAGWASAELPWDFCSVARGEPPTAGALEPGEAVVGSFAAYAEERCPPREYYGDSGYETGGWDSEEPPVAAAECGCVSGKGAGWWWVGAVIGLGQRGRDRTAVPPR